MVGVADAPFFKEDHDPVYSWPGNIGNLTCVVQAEPLPTFRWFRFDQEIMNNETFRVYHMYNSSNLQVSPGFYYPNINNKLNYFILKYQIYL